MTNLYPIITICSLLNKLVLLHTKLYKTLHSVENSDIVETV